MTLGEEETIRDVVIEIPAGFSDPRIPGGCSDRRFRIVRIMKTREEMWGSDPIRFLVSTTIVIEEQFVDSMGVPSWRLARTETPHDRANRDAAIDNAISELFDRSIQLEKEIADLKSSTKVDHPESVRIVTTSDHAPDPMPAMAPDPMPEPTPEPSPSHENYLPPDPTHENPF